MLSLWLWRNAAIIALLTGAVAGGGCLANDKGNATPNAAPSSGPNPATILLAQKTRHQASTPRRAMPQCKAIPFVANVQLAEASGTAFFEDAGLVVVSDSGHNGNYQILEPSSGRSIEQGKLDIGGSSDDFEGLTVSGQTLYALTSSGILSEFARVSNGFKRKRNPYPIGPPQPGCPARKYNCGANYEGMCLGTISNQALSGCVGVAVSKRRGTLVCLVKKPDGRLAIDNNRTLKVARSEILSGCSIDQVGSVWIATNLLGANTLIEVTAKATWRYSTWAVGSIEAIAKIGKETILFSDTQRAPSAAFRYRCKRPEIVE